MWSGSEFAAGRPVEGWVHIAVAIKRLIICDTIAA